MNKQSHISGRVAIVTGAGGTLCSAMAIDLAKQGYKVALLGRTAASLQTVETAIEQDGGVARSYVANVADQTQVETAARQIRNDLGLCSVLINGAGGNQADAVTTRNTFSESELGPNEDGERGFFNLNMSKFAEVIEINTMGTVIPCFVFASDMAKGGGGTIINFASMNTYRPLSRVPAYAIAKAGIANFTQWLATYLAPAQIRVNAIAPGFFVNDRSKKILVQPDGTYTERGHNVIKHTPMRKFGEANELLGCMNWLIDEQAAAFVTGITVPVDGGFLASSGI